MDKVFYAKGRRGKVYLAQREGRTVIVKEPNPDAAIETIGNEAAVLREVNFLGIGPRLLEHSQRKIVMEYIEGEEIMEWIEGSDAAAIRSVLLDVLRQCRALDVVGISKKELTRPHRHIIIRDGLPVQIDFDRAIRTDRPQNVTQFCQWLTLRTTCALLQKKNIVVPVTRMREAARRYKHGYGKEEFDAIVRILGD